MPEQLAEFATRVCQVDAIQPEAEAIAEAAALLRQGELVAFPTETVYGLGANALDARAVARIFAAKGRPAYNPLIVHLADAPAAQAVVAEWPEIAERLATTFWPGPLTLVLPRKATLPDIVTGGGTTVGVRVPAHPVALALLRAAEVPIAAPSANRSEQLSPTRAEHVLSGLNGRIPLVLDGGPTSGGLESTVLNLTTTPPTLLRPGLISPETLEAVIGPLRRPTERKPEGPEAELPLSSPGQMARHYAPHAPLELIRGNGASNVKKCLAQGERVGWLRNAESAESPLSDANLVVVTMPSDPLAYAAQLYAQLHALDAAGISRIIVERPPSGEDWLAIHDRLQRAATPSSASSS